MLRNSCSPTSGRPIKGHVRATVTLRRWRVQSRLRWILSLKGIFAKLRRLPQCNLENAFVSLSRVRLQRRGAAPDRHARREQRQRPPCELPHL